MAITNVQNVEIDYAYPALEPASPILVTIAAPADTDSLTLCFATLTGHGYTAPTITAVAGGGVTWVPGPVATYGTGAGDLTVQWWSGLGCVSGGPTLTVTFDDNPGNTIFWAGLWVDEWTEVNHAVDATAVGSGNDDPADYPITTMLAGDLVLAGCAEQNWPMPVTAPSAPWTSLAGGGAIMGCAYQVVGPANAYTPDFSGFGGTAAAVALLALQWSGAPGPVSATAQTPTESLAHVASAAMDTDYETFVLVQATAVDTPYEALQGLAVEADTAAEALPRAMLEGAWAWSVAGTVGLEGAWPWGATATVDLDGYWPFALEPAPRDWAPGTVHSLTSEIVITRSNDTSLADWEAPNVLAARADQDGDTRLMNVIGVDDTGAFVVEQIQLNGTTVQYTTTVWARVLEVQIGAQYGTNTIVLAVPYYNSNGDLVTSVTTPTITFYVDDNVTIGEGVIGAVRASLGAGDFTATNF